MFFVWEVSFPQLDSSHALFVFSVIHLLVFPWQSSVKLKLKLQLRIQGRGLAPGGGGRGTGLFPHLFLDQTEA